MKEIPPIAGFPLYLKDFLSLLSKKNCRGSLEEDFKNYLRLPYAQITYSGTAAFYLILESLKELSEKKTVIIPSFICPLVPLAIKRAGLKIEVCDITADSFNFEYAQLQGLCENNKDILAIVATHLAGIPVDIVQVNNIAKKYNIFVIEDCAQGLGALYKGKKAGSLGDFAFFSLCRGKGLTIYEGGVLAAKNPDYAKIIDNKIKKLVRNDYFSEGLKIFELLGYWAFYRPQLFWFVFRLPQKFWYLCKEPLRALGDYFTEDFPTHRVSRIRKSIGHVTFRCLEEKIEKQREKADTYIHGLKNTPGIRLITESPQDKAIYPYLTLIFDSPEKRQKVLRAFEDSGLGVSQIYMYAITEYEYLKNTVGNKICPNASSLAQRHITLTTSTYLKKDDIGLIVNRIKNI